MDIVTYALCKKLAASITAGVKSMSVEGTTLQIETSDGHILEIEFPTPADGVSITDVEINNSHHLICTMSDGTTVDAGEMPMYIPQKGVDYYTEEDQEAIVQDVINHLDSGAVLEII